MSGASPLHLVACPDCNAQATAPSAHTFTELEILAHGRAPAREGDELQFGVTARMIRARFVPGRIAAQSGLAMASLAMLLRSGIAQRAILPCLKGIPGHYTLLTRAQMRDGARDVLSAPFEAILHHAARTGDEKLGVLARANDVQTLRQLRAASAQAALYVLGLTCGGAMRTPCVDPLNRLADVSITHGGADGAQWIIARNAKGLILLDALGKSLRRSPALDRGSRRALIAAHLAEALPRTAPFQASWADRLPWRRPRGRELLRAAVECKAITCVARAQAAARAETQAGAQATGPGAGQRAQIPPHIWHMLAPYGLTSASRVPSPPPLCSLRQMG
ncbi:hypothetical protein ACS3SW_19960 [Roseobacteraceae bacterium S113]